MARQIIPANTPWTESICYSRAIRVGSFVAVSQTSAIDEHGVIVGGNDPYAQAVQALHNVERALQAAGAGLADVVRTRIYLAKFEDLPHVAKAHAKVFRDIRPAISILTCTMVSPNILVEFDADALVEGSP